MLLGSDPVGELATCDAPSFSGFVCIPSPVPNAVTRLMLIDLAPQLGDDQIMQIVNLVSLPQPGYPQSVTFQLLEAGIIPSPTSGALQAVAAQLESFTLPIELSVTVYTDSGSFLTFRTC